MRPIEEGSMGRFAAGGLAGLACLLALGVGLPVVQAADSSGVPPASAPAGIGAVTSVQGRVTMDHPDPADPFQASTTEPLQHHDIIETHGQSKTKILLHSGGTLTVGENSRIEIVEHDHDTARADRSVTIKLERGSLRVLVGSDFETPDSKFEIQTPTARAVTRSGLFVVWTDGETSGAANVGQAGSLELSSAGQTARLSPGEFTEAVKGRAPKPPALLASQAHARIQSTVNETHLRESVRHEAPKDTLREIGLPRAIGLGLGGAAAEGGAAGGGAADAAKSQDQSAGVDEAQGGGQSASNKSQLSTHRQMTPAHSRTTPPSVHSRASERILRPTETSPIRGELRTRQ